MVANVPGSVPAGGGGDPERASPLGHFAANLNHGLSRRTSGELVIVAANPGRRRSEAGAVGASSPRSWPTRPGAAASRASMMVYPDGTPQPSRRRFPTVSGTIVRRTPLRKLVPQRQHFHLDEALPTEPVQADWMLGGFLLLRRAMLDELGGFDEGFRLYGEDIDLQYRAEQGRLGALVRAGSRRSPRAPGGDRPALADAPHALALARHRPLRPQAPGEAARPVSTIDKFDRLAAGYATTTYADPAGYAQARANVVVPLGVLLAPGETRCSISPAATRSWPSAARSRLGLRLPRCRRGAGR